MSEAAKPVVKKEFAGCGGGCACAAAKAKPEAESKSKAAGGCCGGAKAGGCGPEGDCCSQEHEEEEVFDPSKPLTDKMKAKLAAAVGTAPMMVFIKGTPSEPKCKFSRAMLRFLMENNITKFGYFDILGDQNVREALKVYSNWKTYPQLYIDSELIGGLDVVKELHADGQLMEKVPPSCLGKGLFPRIKKIVDSKTVMLFLKGTPSEPQDDETKAIVAMLRENAPEFGFYDVTQEPSVQSGLLQYAMQTTYPQVFAFGEHVGGHKEMIARQSEGKLKELLSKPAPLPAKA